MLILGIETSCDETSAALVEDGRRIATNLVSSQTDLHRAFGGVVPEIASRSHLEVLFPLLDEALRQAGCALAQADAIAFTRGPGLIGSLLIGTSAAKAIAYALKKPLIGVHHLKAHVYAPRLEGAEYEFPLVALVVSGGHTSLIAAESWEKAKVIGQTRDDAAGEAFDKVANLLGLGFPGGPAIDAAAAKGDPKRFRLPRGMRSSGDYDFSFSGLKTAVRLLLEKERKGGGEVPTADIAASFQAAAVDVLVRKLTRAVEEIGARTAVVCGGVARNRLLRARAEEAFSAGLPRLHIPSPILCTDNAAMVAGVGYLRLQAGLTEDFSSDAEAGMVWGEGLY
jgi:N6-L-threonylcarbamoyladenine synthase